jgi:Arc/MetJ family transcription regulator
MVDHDLLKEALKLSGVPTYSAVVHEALEHYVRGVKARRILDLRGSGLWAGDLGEMRRDRPLRRKPPE